MKKLISLCTKSLETEDFHKLAKGKGEYLTNVLKCYIKSNTNLYNEILSLVQKPISEIPQDHKPIIKLLKYNVGAKANLHQDECVYGTSIILLDSSNDLQGGDTCIKTDEFEIIDMKPGDNVFHPKGRWHGVTKVTKGFRNVLVLVW